ncbi:MAG: hypothetical protein HQ500_04785 [Flavobacteriales bacterium]|nr:hypothetical protein [Flavobacteriales bacterium]
MKNILGFSRLALLLSTVCILTMTSYGQETTTEEEVILITHLAGQKDNAEVKLSDILRTRGIFVTEYDDDERWQVITYKLRLDRGERISECTNKGANYSNNCKAYVGALQIGNSVEVFDVKVSGKDGTVHSAPNIKLDITEK